MPYYSIEEIKVGSNQKGKAWGGYIFGASLSIGFDAKPTQLGLSIVSSDGEYSISKGDLTFESETLIKLGLSDGLELKMFPVRYEISKGGDQKTLMVVYVDRSKILDRVYVGRLNEHTRRDFQTTALTASVPISCPSCDGSPNDRRLNYSTKRKVETLGFIGNSSSLAFKKIAFTIAQATYSNVTNNIKRYVVASRADPSFDENSPAYHYSAGAVTPINTSIVPLSSISVGGLSYGIITETITHRVYGYFDYIIVPSTTPIVGYISGDPILGGFIGIGTEEFSQSTCSSSAVTYSLKELKALVRTFGISFETSTVGSDSVETIPDGIDQLRRNYSGTLREVLLQWGVEYGFSFTYDFIDHKIIGIDRRSPVLSIDTIKQAVYDSDSLTDVEGSPIIESASEEVSIEDTSKNYYVTAYKRDQKIKRFTQRIYNQAFFYRLTLADVMTLPLAFSNYNQLYVACVIAETLGKTAWQNFLQKEGVYQFLLDADKLPQQQKIKALNLSFDAFEMHDGAADGQLLTRVFETHRSLAGFINSFYFHVGFTPWDTTCCRDTDSSDSISAPTLKFQMKSSFDERVDTFYPLTTINTDCITAPVFSNPVYGDAVPSYGRVFGAYKGLLRGVRQFLSFKFPSQTYSSVSFLERSANYSVSSSAYDTATRQKIYHFTDSQARSDILKNISNSVIAKETDTILISYDNQPNPKESVKPSEIGTYECKMKCEESIVSQACDPSKCISNIYQRVDKAWQRGLLDNVGDFITVTESPVLAGASFMSAEIISPSNAPYQCNFIYEQDSTYIIPGTKEIIEKFDSPPGDVGRVSSTVNDVSSDLDTYFDSGGNIVSQVFVPQAITGSHVVTVKDYDDQIRLDNELVEASLTEPTERFTFTVPGLLKNSSVLAGGSTILKPEKGLTSISISLSDKGISSTYEFSTRPPSAPPQFSPLTWNKVGAKFVI